MLTSFEILGEVNTLLEDDEKYGFIKDGSGNVIFDEIAYLNYWGIIDEKS